MRILNVIHTVDPASGGPGEGVRQMVRATARLGHVQEVLTMDAVDAPWVTAFPGPIHAIGPSGSTYGYLAALAPWLRAHAASYDAMIVHGLWQYHGLAVRQAARRAGRPYFVYPHGMLDPWFRRYYPLKHLKKWLYWPWAEYRVLRDAEAVLFTADEEPVLARQSFWLYRVRESVVGYGLALDEQADTVTAEPFLDRFGQARGQRLVLFLGRLHEKKGCDLLVQAFARVAGQDPRLMLVMAGPDQAGLRTRLEDTVARAGLQDRVLWTGMLTGAMKWSAFRAAEVFALPSHQENFGIAVAEAMAVGVPVLVSRRVNIWREIVEDGAGFAAEDDLEGTTSLLQRWLALDGAQRHAMCRAARSGFQQRFHIDAAAQRLVKRLAQPSVTAARGTGLLPSVR